ncbi:MAG: hypothetical protein HQK83_10370 [Fibrobacteria bacterium]|nr:hypothetical protein [Fibrobacteria bacterium]
MSISCVMKLMPCSPTKLQEQSGIEYKIGTMMDCPVKPGNDMYDVHTKTPNSAVLFFPVLLLLAVSSFALQDYDKQDLGYLTPILEEFKKDAKGPFAKIQWYCPDGSVIPAQNRCKQPGGIQHAALKKVPEGWQKRYHLFLGQILAGTENEDFYDSAYGFSRMKQFQIEKYLKQTDEGWILRKARYYRGAYQIEDEEAWSEQFLIWLFSKKDMLTKNFYLARQLVNDLPLSTNSNLSGKIRITSKVIAEKTPSFMDIRVKLHSHPDSSDIQRVRTFQKSLKNNDKDLEAKLSELIQQLTSYYHNDQKQVLQKNVALVKSQPVVNQVKELLSIWDTLYDLEKIKKLSDLLLQIRKTLSTSKTGKENLNLLRFSLQAEQILFRISSQFTPTTLADWIALNEALARSLTGCGFIELWEWEQTAPQLHVGEKTLSGESIQHLVYLFRRTVEWSVSLINAHYQSEVERFSRFEPLTKFFIDEKLRSSVLFAAGLANNGLAEKTAQLLLGKISNEHLVRSARGINPGIALGVLEVIDEVKPDMDIKSDRIYVFPKAPQDLHPVAGILSVSEGNPISHIQLLARNLGIPNGVISTEQFQSLKKLHGQKVLLAITPKSSVWLKKEADMTKEDYEVVKRNKEEREKLTINTKKLELEHYELTSLDQLRSKHSGRICGPKAAHLGELHHLFPGSVAPGFIIPFGVFRSHLEQVIPGKSISFWQFLKDTYKEADKRKAALENEESIERYILSRLKIVREDIESIPLMPEFKQALKQQFKHVLGAPVGNTGVFIRSDTNMEDLKKFTGAGLNLTVPNVVTERDLFNSIKKVWASPFSDRSYLWRQRYLNNAMDVYPSILILKSVNADKSGVIITKDFVTNDEKAMTITFNRGVGGAVSGQSGESYVVSRKGESLLLSPARDLDYIRLPDKGGVDKITVSLENRILSEQELQNLYSMGLQLRKKLAASGMRRPYDIELGIVGDKIWLFQARPLSESKGGKTFAYLHTLDDNLPLKKTIHLNEDK